MKRAMCFVFCLIVTMSLASCFSDYNADSYNSGFSEGFYRGQEEAYEEGYDAGYYYGYEEGYQSAVYNLEEGKEYIVSIQEAVEEASWYALEKEGWSAYEAAQNVALYLDGDPSVTSEEFEESARALLLFYDYFEQEKYK